MVDCERDERMIQTLGKQAMRMRDRYNFIRIVSDYGIW
jgi:hypothetical protein